MAAPRPVAWSALRRGLGGLARAAARGKCSAAPGGHKTGVQVTNRLTQQKEPLLTHTPGVLTWYQCGPTVLLQRQFGLQVLLAQGVTDIDDKIITRAAAEGCEPIDVAKKYEEEFATQMAALNVLPPTMTLRVTEHIPDIIDFISRIESQGHAYSSADSVYFDTEAFVRTGGVYGKLQPKRDRSSTSHSSVETQASPVKRHPADFALWKNATDGCCNWASPWGTGRPGWHIECSAMASKVFGKHLDLHTGGIDLAFPHHENEMAQSESAHKTSQWGQCYLHAGHVMLRNAKMSKSVGNVIKVSDLLQNISSDEFRMLCLLYKYRDSFNYDGDVMKEAVRTHNRFRNFVDDSTKFVMERQGVTPTFGSDEARLVGLTAATRMACDEKFADDFNTPGAIFALLDLVRHTNRYIEAYRSSTTTGSAVAVTAVTNLVCSILDMLGVGGFAGSEVYLGCDDGSQSVTTAERPDSAAAADALVQFRAAVRADALAVLRNATSGPGERVVAQNILQHCDQVRDKLKTLGPAYMIKDGASS